jgi:hypothetical protein
MQSKTLARLGSASFRALRLTCGLALVLGVCASTAFAGGPPLPVPEIDPGSIAGALTVLTGGMLMLTDRLRKKS